VTYPFVSIFINFLHPRSKYYDNVVLMGINVLFFFFFFLYPIPITTHFNSEWPNKGRTTNFEGS